MPVARRTIDGAKYWVIDRRFRSADGREERFRRVAQVQTRPGAEAEERRLVDYWQQHGTIKPLLKAEAKPAKGEEQRKRPAMDGLSARVQTDTLPCDGTFKERAGFLDGVGRRGAIEH